jgi:hypothetical protein
MTHIMIFLLVLFLTDFLLDEMTEGEINGWNAFLAISLIHFHISHGLRGVLLTHTAPVTEARMWRMRVRGDGRVPGGR